MIDSVSKAFKDFILTISLKKMNVLGQSTEAPPVVTIDYYILEVVCDFTYLGMTITYNLSLDKEIDKRIGKAATTLTRHTTRVWFSMFTLLRQCRLCWLGHVHRVHDGSIPKDTLCGELVFGKRNSGHPQLQFKDVTKRDTKAGLNKSRECTPCQYSTLRGVILAL